MKKRITGLSDCHLAEMTIGGTPGSTMYYVCTKCRKPCDPVSMISTDIRVNWLYRFMENIMFVLFIIAFPFLVALMFIIQITANIMRWISKMIYD